MFLAISVLPNKPDVSILGFSYEGYPGYDPY
jgi:hypothetical protein